MYFKIHNEDRRIIVHRFLELLSTLNPDPTKVLTPSEITMFTEFLLLPEKYKYQRFSRPAKDYVRQVLQEEFNMKLSKVNMNNKIYSIRDKGYIYTDTDRCMYIKVYLIQAIQRLLDTLDAQQPYKIVIEFGSKGRNTDSKGAQ